jgi:hypothetical protein
VKIEQVRELLFEAATLRLPRLRELDGGTIAKVNALEDYLVETAIWRGRLEEARMWMHEAHADLLAQWDDIEGWEMFAPNHARRTQDDIRRAKKKCRPELATSIQTAKHLIARLSDQIRRFENDDAATSRLYTIVTGN